MLIKLSYQDWLRIGEVMGMLKQAQDAPPGGGAPAGGAGGTLSGVDPVLVDSTESNDRDLVKKLNSAFHRALKAGKDVDDALLIACQAVDSRVFPSQLDVDETKDPPEIRGWSGLELGPKKPAAPAPPPAPPGGAMPPM
jgi:hypothetical protein